MKRCLNVADNPPVAQVNLPCPATFGAVNALGPALLLPEEDTRCVQPAVAARFGLNAALLLQQLHWRLRKPSHIVAGVPWYEASYADWHRRDLPFLCAKTIERTARRLERLGVITAKCLNRNKYDRTRWYTINADMLAAQLGCTSEQNVPMDAPSSPLLDRDNVSPSLEEEEREKEEPTAVFSTLHRITW